MGILGEIRGLPDCPNLKTQKMAGTYQGQKCQVGLIRAELFHSDSLMLTWPSIGLSLALLEVLLLPPSLLPITHVSSLTIPSRHPVFPGGHPSKYWLNSIMRNFRSHPSHIKLCCKFFSKSFWKFHEFIFHRFSIKALGIVLGHQ